MIRRPPRSTRTDTRFPYTTLFRSTAALVDAARDEAGAAGLTSHLLVFLPTVLDPYAPELRRANVPAGWAAPAFDVLQLEDYDWVTAGRGAETAGARDAMIPRPGYPAGQQHYFAGFVLNGADRARGGIGGAVCREKGG